MKKSFIALAIVALVSFALPPLTELPIGSPIPNPTAKLKDVSGQEISLEAARKKNGLLVMFSCNTCPYVVKNQQRTKYISAYALKNEIGVVLLNSNEGQRSSDDSFEAMKSYAKQQGYNWHYAVDQNNAMADAFGATRTPENFLFNKDGKLVYRGAIDDNPDASAVTRKHLQAAIDEMLSGKAVSIATSRSVGCGIKRIN